MKKNIKGITLIALVVTIVVLIILSGVTIASFIGKKGIFSLTNNSKENLEIETEKELVYMAKEEAKLNSIYGNVKEEDLKKNLDNNIGEGEYKIEKSGKDYYVTFLKSNRIYKINTENDVELVDEIVAEVKDETPGDYTNGGKLDGSLETPYEISSIEDLAKFSKDGTKKHDLFKEKKIILTRNLDFKDTESYCNSKDTSLFDDYNNDGDVEGIMEELTDRTHKGFEPIEDFKGIFDGQNHTISNFYINTTDETYLGFFDDLSQDATVRNLNLQGEIKFEANTFSDVYNRIGGVVGRITSENGKYGTVENCTSYVDINVNINKLIEKKSTTFYIGGIAGNNEGSINNCKNYGNINVTIARDVPEGTSTSGEILGTEFFVGGVAGKCQGTILNSANYGKVYYKATNITDFNVSSSDKVGGVAGTSMESDNLKVNNCANYGTVEATSVQRLKVGGISGENGHNSDETLVEYAIENTYNKGNIKATVTNGSNNLEVGGISGANSGSLINCYNIGEIESSETKYLGYIVGNVKSGYKIKDCEYLVIDENIKGGQLKDVDEASPTNKITPKTNLTEKDVKEKMNKNVIAHNKTSNEKWNEW